MRPIPCASASASYCPVNRLVVILLLPRQPHDQLHRCCCHHSQCLHFLSALSSRSHWQSHVQSLHSQSNCLVNISVTIIVAICFIIAITPAPLPPSSAASQLWPPSLLVIGRFALFGRHRINLLSVITGIHQHVRHQRISARSASPSCTLHGLSPSPCFCSSLFVDTFMLLVCYVCLVNHCHRHVPRRKRRYIHDSRPCEHGGGCPHNSSSPP